MRRRTRLILASVAAAAAVMSGGVAWAYWSSDGAGSASASTATMQPLSVSALAGGDRPTSSLLPGGTAEVVLRVTNPNAFTVRLYAISAAGTITVDSGHSGCTGSPVAFTPPTSPDIPVAGNGTMLVRLADAASMALSAPSACQGATFTVPVTVAART
jgi:hypothetical protein